MWESFECSLNHKSIELMKIFRWTHFFQLTMFPIYYTFYFTLLAFTSSKSTVETPEQYVKFSFKKGKRKKMVDLLT